MIIATAATLHAHGTTHIDTTKQAAMALKPVAGNFAFLHFACDIVGTGLLPLLVLAGSAAYAVASPFSVRARPGLGMSMPDLWKDLPKLKSGAQWTIATAREHLSFQTVDPWNRYWTSKQSLIGPMKILGFKARPQPKAKAWCPSELLAGVC